MNATPMFHALAKARLMLERVEDCELKHGGLLTRDALRAAHEFRAAILSLDARLGPIALQPPSTLSEEGASQQ
jgi:hypothetical protein